MFSPSGEGLRHLIDRGKGKMKKATNECTLAIIPCYNEEATIGSIVIRTKRHVGRVLVVDDGSTDDTARIAKEAGATVLSHKTNKGKSAGIKTGFKYALVKGFDYVVTIDGDGQHNPDEIPVVLGNLRNNGHDITLGVRYGESTEMPLWRKFGKRLLDYTTSFGNGGHVTDSQCGFRAFNKKAVQGITPRLNGSEFSTESEQLIKAHDLGLKVEQTRVMCRYKGLDTSTKTPSSHGLSVLRYIIWQVAEKRPLLFIGFPGFIMLIIGLFFGIQTLQVYNQTGVFLIPSAIVTSIFLIIGVLAMFIGLMLNVLPNIIQRAKMDFE
jgi:glycosyltransferase involved in cell wall biosynthesis